ncbi:MAG: nuclear transport factor 2 family protein [Bacteroidetes bacterium]|nr:nuclear transport factor 2 family protein [Bacteroidota bacterium]
MKKAFQLTSILVLVILLSLTIISCSPKQDEYKIQAWKTVKTINRLWAIERDIDSLALFFHKNMVLIAPSRFERYEGEKEIIKSYQDYLNVAEVIFFIESNPRVDIYENTAIVCYDYHAKLCFSKKDTIETKGRDMYILTFENNKWKAVANQFSTINN